MPADPTFTSWRKALEAGTLVIEQYARLVRGSTPYDNRIP